MNKFPIQLSDGGYENQKKVLPINEMTQYLKIWNKDAAIHFIIGWPGSSLLICGAVQNSMFHFQLIFLAHKSPN